MFTWNALVREVSRIGKSTSYPEYKFSLCHVFCSCDPLDVTAATLVRWAPIGATLICSRFSAGAQRTGELDWCDSKL